MKTKSIRRISNIEETLKAIKDGRTKEALEFGNATWENIIELEEQISDLKDTISNLHEEVNDLNSELRQLIDSNDKIIITTAVGDIEYIEPAHIVHREIMERLGEKLNKVGHNEIQRILDAI